MQIQQIPSSDRDVTHSCGRLKIAAESLQLIFIMVTFDVVSQYTNKPHNMVTDDCMAALQTFYDMGLVTI